MRKSDVIFCPLLCATFLWNGLALAAGIENESFEKHPKLLALDKIEAMTNEEEKARAKKALYKDLTMACPLKSGESQISDILTASLSITFSSNMTEKKREECNSLLAGFNDSLYKSQELDAMMGESSANIDEEKRQVLTKKLNDAVTATTNFRALIRAQCQYENDGERNKAVKVGYHLSNVVDTGSSILFLFNPFAAIIGVASAATGRLLTTMGQWIFGKNENQLAEEAAEAEHFVKDLCSFRELAQKYDSSYIDPFEKNLNREKVENETKKYEERKKERAQKLAELKLQEGCVGETQTEIDKLHKLSEDLATVLNKGSQQKQCLELINLYASKKTKEDRASLHFLSAKYGCPTPREESPFTHKAYCKNMSALQSMVNEDLYENCEKEDFQKNVNAKFTNLTDMILRDIDENSVTTSPINDAIQKLYEAEEKDKVKHQEFLAAQKIMETSPVVEAGALKAMTNSGRNLLGPRFNNFAEINMENAHESLADAVDLLAEQAENKKKLDSGKKGLLSGKMSSEERGSLQKEMCKKAAEGKRKLQSAHHSMSGVRDVCDFMSGQGIPPLKDQGFNYDTYSAELDDQDNNISNRCHGLQEKIKKNAAVIKEQMALEASLGCP